MNKKLMAVAVAGALAAPAGALAQTTIYGFFNVEYGIASQPDHPTSGARHDAEAWNSGASRFGLRGEEKMGGGLSAFYQCESDVRFLGGVVTQTSGTICDRNSAIGLRGGFGSVYFGSWDTPLKRVSGIVRITDETGWTGSQHITLSPKESGMRNFSNRPAGTVNYDTPNLGGFSGSLQFTALNQTRDAIDVAAPAGVTVVEGRNISLSGQYMAGPLAVVAGYEKGDENCAGTAGNCAASATTTVNDEATGWLIGASYVFGPIKVGITYTNLEVKIAGTTKERPAWNLAGEWMMGGPHSLRVGYAQADDLDINGATQASSGAKQYQVRYNYAFSKRTAGYAAYVKVDNDTNGTFNLTGLTAGSSTTAVKPGDSADVIAFGLSHTF